MPQKPLVGLRITREPSQNLFFFLFLFNILPLFFLQSTEDDFKKKILVLTTADGSEVDGEFFLEPGQSLHLRCIIQPIGTSFQLNWLLPNVTNQNLEGFDESDYRRRIQVENNDRDSTINISHLNPTDTGNYVCQAVFNNAIHFSKSTYVFVKGTNLFLGSYSKALTLHTKVDFFDFIVPCRTTKPIEAAKMKLFVNNLEWLALCGSENRSVSVLWRGPNNRSLTDFRSQNCSQLWEYYNPRTGFNISSLSTTMQWSQLNNKRFRCEYERENVEFSIWATRTITKYKGSQHERNCTLHTNQVLYIDAKKAKLTLACPGCDHKDESFVERLVQRFHEDSVLEDLEIGKRVPSTHNSLFCKWIENMGNGSTDVAFPFEVQPIASQTQFNSKHWAEEIDQDLALLILWGSVFVLLVILVPLFGSFYMMKQRRKTNRDNRFDGGIRNRNAEPSKEKRQVQQVNEIEQMEDKDLSHDFLIGNGTYGIVYKLKNHDPPRVVKWLQCPNEASSLKGFKRECEALQKLKHQHIIQLFRIKVIKGLNKFGIVTEYCERGDLKKLYFEATIIYNMRTVVVWGRQLFDALTHMYKTHSYIHRDLKPENIFVTEGFLLKIGDFGLVKHIRKTCAGTYAGTERYMSPPDKPASPPDVEPASPPNVEPASPPDVEPASPPDERASPQISHLNDVYSLGLVLWELVERRLVFGDYDHGNGFYRDGFIADIASGALKELTTSMSFVQDIINRILFRCADFQRCSRPQACVILKELKELEEVLGTSKLPLLPIIERDRKKLLRPIDRQEVQTSVSTASSLSPPTMVF